MFTLEPFSKDATEDILFNRGGAQFAKWVLSNNEPIIKYHLGESEKLLRAALEADPDGAKLSER